MLASTDVDFTILVVGDDAASDGDDLVDQINSNGFTDSLGTSSGTTATVSSAESENYEADPLFDDMAFSTPVSVMTLAFVMMWVVFLQA